MPRHSRKNDPPRINLPIADIHIARREESGRGELCLWFLHVRKHFHIWQAKDIEAYCDHSHWKGMRPRWWLCSLMYSPIKCKKKILALSWPLTSTSINTFLERSSVLGTETKLIISSWKQKLWKCRRTSEIHSKFFLGWKFREVD